MTSSRTGSKGALLVEVVVVSSIILTFMLVLISAFSIYLKLSLADKHRIQAAALAEEALEAVRFLRDVSWSEFSDLTIDTDYYVTFSGTKWNISTEPTAYIEGIFERKFRLEDVYRDSNRQIVTSGGSVDAEARLVRTLVSWRENSATTSKSLSTILTNY